jgi:hypothetical protein
MVSGAVYTIKHAGSCAVAGDSAAMACGGSGSGTTYSELFVVYTPGSTTAGLGIPIDSDFELMSKQTGKLCRAQARLAAAVIVCDGAGVTAFTYTGTGFSVQGQAVSIDSADATTVVVNGGAAVQFSFVVPPLVAGTKIKMHVASEPAGFCRVVGSGTVFCADGAGTTADEHFIASKADGAAFKGITSKSTGLKPFATAEDLMAAGTLVYLQSVGTGAFCRVVDGSGTTTTSLMGKMKVGRRLMAAATPTATKPVATATTTKPANKTTTTTTTGKKPAGFNSTSTTGVVAKVGTSAKSPPPKPKTAAPTNTTAKAKAKPPPPKKSTTAKKSPPLAAKPKITVKPPPPKAKVAAKKPPPPKPSPPPPKALYHTMQMGQYALQCDAGSISEASVLLYSGYGLYFWAMPLNSPNPTQPAFFAGMGLGSVVLLEQVSSIDVVPSPPDHDGPCPPPPPPPAGHDGPCPPPPPPPANPVACKRPPPKRPAPVGGAMWRSLLLGCLCRWPSCACTAGVLQQCMSVATAVLRRHVLATKMEQQHQEQHHRQ